MQAYQTNHRGHRVDREVTRLFYDGLGRRLVKEYDPKTGAGGVKRTECVFDHLDPVAEYFLWNGQQEEFYRGGVEAFSPTPMLLALRHFPEGTQGQTYWYHLDGRGSVAGLTKHQGQSTHNYRYDASDELHCQVLAPENFALRISGQVRRFRDTPLPSQRCRVLRSAG